MTHGDDLAAPILPETEAVGGLTKLEYFAAAALQGLIPRFKSNWEWSDIDYFADKSVELAKALINSLNKG